MMTFLQQAMDEKIMFYEQASDFISAVSGTVQHTIGIRPADDPTIQRLRDRAKKVLLCRKTTKQEQRKEAVDLRPIFKLIDEDGDNKDLTTKRLRAKLTTLMIIDSAARPDTIRNCMIHQVSYKKTDNGTVITCISSSTKDQNLAKDKTQRKLIFEEFPFKPNICTIATMMEYSKRLEKFKLAKDISVAGLNEEGKPANIKTHSIMVKLTEPHESLRSTTVRSECRKYLESLNGKGIGPKELRKAIPSIIQFIDGTTDEEAAKKFRWMREDTYKQWYKSSIPDDVKKALKQIKQDLPTSWKLRHSFITKHKVAQHYRTLFGIKAKKSIKDHFVKP